MLIEILDDSEFWEWMSLEKSITHQDNDYVTPICNSDHVFLLSKMIYNKWDCLNLLGFDYWISKGAATLDRLSRHIPRKYLLEIQYCLASYSSVFGTIFPSMLSYLDNLAYIEWLLFTETDNQRYRDHLVHMFKVAFVCNKLLQIDAIRNAARQSQFSSEHFLQWCSSKNFANPAEWDNKKKESLIYIAIYISAIFHDFGYGYQYFCNYRDRLANILPSLKQDNNYSDLRRNDLLRMINSLPAKYILYHHIANDLNSESNELLISGFIRDHLSLNHSMASGLFIVDMADNLREKNAISDELYLAFHLAAEAAMLHDMAPPGKSLHYQAKTDGGFFCFDLQTHAPIAALLYFADNIEFGSRKELVASIDDLECRYYLDCKNENSLELRHDEKEKCLICRPCGFNKKNNVLYNSLLDLFSILGIPIKTSFS